ncbi:hypothetical protein [Nocardioides montaniterrae]
MSDHSDDQPPTGSRYEYTADGGKNAGYDSPIGGMVGFGIILEVLAGIIAVVAWPGTKTVASDCFESMYSSCPDPTTKHTGSQGWVDFAFVVAGVGGMLLFTGLVAWAVLIALRVHAAEQPGGASTADPGAAA